MADDNDITEETPDSKPRSTYKKKAPAKKSTPKPSRYLVAKGRSISTGGRIIDEGSELSADDVADIEALLKGGFVVKA